MHTVMNIINKEIFYLFSYLLTHTPTHFHFIQLHTIYSAHKLSIHNVVVSYDRISPYCDLVVTEFVINIFP